LQFPSDGKEAKAMHSQNQSSTPTSTFRTILLIIFITLVVAVIPARAQNAVPATARQAAAMPAFAHRLKPPATPQATGRPVASAHIQTHRGRPLDTGIAYENGPVNGQVDALTINFGFTVSDTIQVNGPVTGIQFWAWLEPGDTVTNVEVQIGGNGYFSNNLFDGVVTLTQSSCFTNNFGLNVCLVSGNFTGPTLSGNDWITLTNANTVEGQPVYWDENSGVGCLSPGCPSLAQENTLGTIPSEAFTLTGGASSTTVDCSHDPELQVIHDFTGGADGADPSGVVTDRAGNLYGTTPDGGTYGTGTAFKLVEGGSNWLLNTLYSFARGAATIGNPSTPFVGANGSLYGTVGGGIENCQGFLGPYCGQVINLTPPPTACGTVMCSWREKVLYQFTGGADAPGGVSASDQEGNLYGAGGGGAHGQGEIYELSPSSGGWTKTVLYNFTGGNDGEGPQSLILRSDGNLYGMAQGGVYGAGLIYQLVRSENGWTQNILYQTSGYLNGLYPFLVQDASGNLYFAQSTYRGNEQEFYVDGDIDELSFVNGGWNVNGVYSIAPTTYNSYVVIRDIASDPFGTVWTAAYAYTFESASPEDETLLFNTITNFGDPYIYLGDTFWAGGMTTDAQGNLYGATNCGAYYRGGVWKVSHN
jgi:uncharacterized repeat protein (TIGR03803 family)